MAAPTFHEVWTPYSILFLAGLGAVVLALLSALPRLGTAFRVAGLVLFLGGAACAITGGVLHSRYDEPRLVEMASGIDPWPVVSTYLGLALSGAMVMRTVAQSLRGLPARRLALERPSDAPAKER